MDIFYKRSGYLDNKNDRFYHSLLKEVYTDKSVIEFEKN